MKRTVLSKMAMAACVFLVGAAMHGAFAADMPKPAGAGGEAVSGEKGDTKGETSGAAGAPMESKGGEMLVPMKVPLGSPLFSGVPVAMVNEDKVTLGEFDELLTAVHQSVTDVEESASRNISFAELLKRLINSRLFAQEARNIGLDQLPEIKEMLGSGEKRILREALYLQVARTAKVDDKELAKVYDLMRKEVKLKSVAFKEEQDAKNFVRQIKGGKNFDELAAKAVQEKLAEVPQGDQSFAKEAQLHPNVVQAVSALKVNGVSSVVPLSKSFIVFKVEAIRFDENPALKETARTNLLSKAQLDKLKAYKLTLYKKYLKENVKLIKTIDYEAAKPGFAKLLDDKRVLVAVKGDKPITVGDLARAMQAKFFHGVEIAAKDKKLNKEKKNLLDEVMSKTVFTKEALAQHIDKTEECRKKIDDFTRSTLFGAFVEKAVRPSIKGTEEDLKAYYKEHIKKFTYPELIKVEALVYKKSADAKNAVDKLRNGMDFKWLQTNAEGLVAKDAPNLLEFGDLVTKSSLPKDVQKSLAGVKAGDYRFYESPEGYGYVLYVASVEPENQQPYGEVRDDVMKAVYADKLAKAVDDWGDKLAKAADIKIYLDLSKQKSPVL